MHPLRVPRKFLPILALCPLAALAPSCTDTGGLSPEEERARRNALTPEEEALAALEPEHAPPIVLLLVDTLRADAVLDPRDRFETPNLDQLGREGLVFQTAFSHAPMTLPSHSSLFSSRPPLETGVRNNGQIVPEDLPLLADWLAQSGYDTRGVISMGTLLPVDSRPGISRGFAAYDVRFLGMDKGEDSLERLRESLDQRDPEKPLFLFAHFSDPHVPYNSHGEEEHWAELDLDGEPLHRVSTSEMSSFDDWIELAPGTHSFVFHSEDAFRIRLFQCMQGGQLMDVDWVESKPLVGGTRHEIQVSVPPSDGAQRVRLRYWVNDVLYGKLNAVRYAREVQYVDRIIGEFLGELRQHGLYDEALIVFTSDHGESLGEHEGFYGHVEYLTDEQIQVPLIFKLPAGDARGALLRRSLDRVVSHLDVTPTILDLAGLPGLPGQRGTSLLRPHDTVHLAETHTPEAPLSKIALRDERYKMIYWIEEEHFVMYDLQNDPGETIDVFEQAERERPEWAARLQVLAQSGADAPREIDEMRRAELEMLGYAGGE